MEAAVPPAPFKSRDMEVWRDAWEREQACRPQDLKRPFPGPTLYNPANEVSKVIRLLNAHGISCCVVGVQALCYYGAHRGCSVREICVPTNKLADADALFSRGVASASYTAWRGQRPELEARMAGCLYHTFPRYRLNQDERIFDFYLMPSEDWRLECTSDSFEYSAQQRIPYPKLHLLAQSLMERHQFNDLQDLVDGMDLTEEWGEQNLKFDTGLSEEYAQWVATKNAKIRAALPQESKDEPMNQMFGTEVYEMAEGPVDFTENFVRSVRTKQRRIGLELEEHPGTRYATRFRLKGSPDPRTRIRFHV